MTLMKPTEGALPAVILAAGRGQRLQRDTQDLPKPLVPLLDKTLLERAVLACQQAGASECYIVVGYDKARMVSQIRVLAQHAHIPLHAVVNSDWEAGNGTSAYAVNPYIEGPFFLIMCDHVFDPALLRALVDAGRSEQSCLLAVDRRTNQIFDLDDATKVRLVGHTIVSIGKELNTFNAIDTGLFLCRPVLFKALQQARRLGDASLSGGMRQLIQAGQLQGVDIGDGFWIDVDTPESLAYAERELLNRVAASKLDSGSLASDNGS
jgi:1L-myo-inositol 1-phosphate cytidylyltransferase